LLKVMGPERCEQRICHERAARIERRFPRKDGGRRYNYVIIFTI